MKKIIGITGAVLILVTGWILSSDTSPAPATSSNEKLTVATSFYPLQYALERIAGDGADVINIGAGRDPHDFRPSTQDMLTLQRADLVVLQGADFEPWGDAVSETLLTEGVPVVFATHGLDLHEGGHAHDEEHEDEDEHEYEEDTSTEQTEDEVGHDDEHEYESHDPHTWLDPVLFSQSVDTLVEALIVIDPTNAAMYETNAEALQADLRVLNTQYAATLSNCNLSEIITSHDAFGYVGDRYGFTIHTIAGISTQDAPSATTLATLRAEAAEGIGAILLEANSVTAYGETLARETGLQTLSINPIAFIIPENETYLSIMNTNLDTFATALNCNE